MGEKLLYQPPKRDSFFLGVLFVGPVNFSIPGIDRFMGLLRFQIDLLPGTRVDYRAQPTLRPRQRVEARLRF